VHGAFHDKGGWTTHTSDADALSSQGADPLGQARMESLSERPFRLRNLKRLPALNNSVTPITGAAMGEVPTSVEAEEREERELTNSVTPITGAAMGEVPTSVEAEEREERELTMAWPEAGCMQSAAGAGRAAYQIETALADVGHKVPPVAPLLDGPGPRGKVVQTWFRRSEDVRIDTPTDKEKKRALDYVQQSRSGSTMLPMSGTLSFATRQHGHSKTDSTAKYLIVPSGKPGGGEGSDGGITHGGVFQNVHLLRLFIEHGWQLPRPDVIITINGGAQFFEMKAEEKDKVMRGMMEGTRHLKPWFVCDGVHGCEANCKFASPTDLIKSSDVVGGVALRVQVCDWWHQLRRDEACRRG
jgi:hypothetical protein